MQDLKILCLQTDIVWNDPEKNRELLEINIMNHVDNHNLVVLPETFPTGFPKFPEFNSEAIDGKTTAWMADIAAKSGAVITGSFLAEKDGRYANTLIWMQPDGSFQQYEKRHVFSMANENQVIDKGTTQLIVELNGWKIKPMICYDLRFPVWSKNSFAEDRTYRYDVALYVANWPGIRSYTWKQLLISRAIENLSYVVGVNRVGRDPHGIYYSGDSLIIDPKGKIISQGEEGKERVLSEELSLAELAEFRKKFNVGPDWDKFSIDIE
jgi:predicted amidohydrolase